MPMHYLPGAVLGSKDHRNSQSAWSRIFGRHAGFILKVRAREPEERMSEGNLDHEQELT